MRRTRPPMPGFRTPRSRTSVPACKAAEHRTPEEHSQRSPGPGHCASLHCQPAAPCEGADPTPAECPAAQRGSARTRSRVGPYSRAARRTAARTSPPRIPPHHTPFPLAARCHSARSRTPYAPSQSSTPRPKALAERAPCTADATHCSAGAPLTRVQQRAQRDPELTRACPPHKGVRVPRTSVRVRARRPRLRTGLVLILTQDRLHLAAILAAHPRSNSKRRETKLIKHREI
jgi:hypothetical protein